MQHSTSQMWKEPGSIQQVGQVHTDAFPTPKQIQLQTIAIARSPYKAHQTWDICRNGAENDPKHRTTSNLQLQTAFVLTSNFQLPPVLQKCLVFCVTSQLQERFGCPRQPTVTEGVGCLSWQTAVVDLRSIRKWRGNYLLSTVRGSKRLNGKKTCDRIPFCCSRILHFLRRWKEESQPIAFWNSVGRRAGCFLGDEESLGTAQNPKTTCDFEFLSIFSPPAQGLEHLSMPVDSSKQCLFEHCKSKTKVEIIWALSHVVICNLTLSSAKSIRELKYTISKRTKVPLRFLDLICGDQVPSDSNRLADYGDEVQFQVLRKKPSELLSIIRQWYINNERITSSIKRERFFSPSDLEVVQYIIATDDGHLVNQKDEIWPEPEDTDEDEEGNLWPRYPEVCHRGCSCLHYAAFLGNADLCKLILDHPGFREANASCTLGFYFYDHSHGWFGSTALHIACSMGLKDIGILLLQHPQFTAVWEKDDERLTALDHALDRGDAKLVSAFLDHFQQTNQKSYSHALDLAMEYFTPDMWDTCVFADMFEVLLQHCVASISSLSSTAIGFLTYLLTDPSRQKMLQKILKQDADGKWLAAIHLGKGRLDLELLMGRGWSKEDLARERDLKLRRRRSARDQVTGKRIWRSKAARPSLKSERWPNDHMYRKLSSQTLRISQM